jgi:phenylpyruvate tautomerase PptA (4-oxalocrotonate tautomerase family)
MDVSFLEPVFAAAGPYATVCADVTHTTETADTELELRVRALTEKLTEQGAPEPVIQTVRDRLLEANEGGEIATLKGRALVVAADGSVVLDSELTGPPRTQIAEWSGHPDVLPILRQLPGRVPHIVVVVDRVGADVSLATRPGEPVEEREVEGDTLHIHKVKVGGWAHHRFLHNTEERWIHNVDQVAELIASMARRHRPAFVLVAGDVRARQILTDRASDPWKDLVVSIDEGGRAAGADREPVERREAELVAEQEAHGEADAVEKVQSAAAHGLAATGTELVVEALRKSQVETLVLADQPDEESLFVGGSPLELGVEESDLQAFGSQQVQIVPADRALLAAAVASKADVVVVPRAAMPGNIPVAAILRYTDASTPSAQ